MSLATQIRVHPAQRSILIKAKLYRVDTEYRVSYERVDSINLCRLTRVFTRHESSCAVLIRLDRDFEYKLYYSKIIYSLLTSMLSLDTQFRGKRLKKLSQHRSSTFYSL